MPLRSRCRLLCLAPGVALVLFCLAQAASATDTATSKKSEDFESAHRRYQQAIEDGDLESAALHARRSYSLARYELGPQHATTGVLAFNLGAVYLELDRYRDAQRALTTAVEIYLETNGTYAIENYPPLWRLAKAHFHLKAWEEAEENFARALQIIERHKGRNDPSTIGVLIDMTTVAEARGEYMRMRNYGRRAAKTLELSAARTNDPEDHARKTGRVHIALARSEAALGNIRRADQHLQYGLELHEAHLNPGDVELGDAYLFAAEFYKTTEKPSSARKYRRKAEQVSSARGSGSQ